MKHLKLIDVEVAVLEMKYGLQTILEAIARHKAISIEDIDEQLALIRAKKSKKKARTKTSATDLRAAPQQSDLSKLSDAILKPDIQK